MDFRLVEELGVTSLVGGALCFVGQKAKVLQQTDQSLGLKGPAAGAAITAGAVFVGEIAHSLIEASSSNMLIAGTGAFVGPATVGVAKMGSDYLLNQSRGAEDLGKSFVGGAVLDVGARYVTQALIGPYVRLPQ